MMQDKPEEYNFIVENNFSTIRSGFTEGIATCM